MNRCFISSHPRSFIILLLLLIPPLLSAQEEGGNRSDTNKQSEHKLIEEVIFSMAPAFVPIEYRLRIDQESPKETTLFGFTGSLDLTLAYSETISSSLSGSLTLASRFDDLIDKNYFTGSKLDQSFSLEEITLSSSLIRFSFPVLDSDTFLLSGWAGIAMDYINESRTDVFTLLGEEGGNFEVLYDKQYYRYHSLFPQLEAGLRLQSGGLTTALGAVFCPFGLNIRQEQFFLETSSSLDLGDDGGLKVYHAGPFISRGAGGIAEIGMLFPSFGSLLLSGRYFLNFAEFTIYQKEENQNITSSSGRIGQDHFLNAELTFRTDFITFGDLIPELKAGYNLRSVFIDSQEIALMSYDWLSFGISFITK